MKIESRKNVLFNKNGSLFSNPDHFLLVNLSKEFANSCLT